MSQPAQTKTSEARDAFTLLEAEHARFETRESEARNALERATHAVQTEGSAASGKNLLATEDAVRIAAIGTGGSSQRLAQARETLKAADHAERLGAHARRVVAVSFMSFAAASRDIASRRAALAAKMAEAQAEAEALCKGFVASAATIGEEARGLGAKPPRALDYYRVLDSFTGRASGALAAAILAGVWNMNTPAGMAPEDALAAVERGVGPIEVARLLADLGRAVAAQKTTAIKLATLGHVPPNPNQERSTSALVQFESSTSSAQNARAALQAMGFGNAQANVPTDALAARLIAAGAQRVGELVTKLRNVDSTHVAGAVNAAQTAAGRARLADTITSELAALGLADIAASVRPSAPSPAPASSGGFVNLNAGV